MPDTGHRWELPQERNREVLAIERRVRRVFVGAFCLSLLIVLLIVLEVTRWAAMPPRMAILYTVILLWVLMVIAYVFLLLLRLVRRVEDDLRDKAFTDALTGAFNYRYLERRLLEEEGRMKRRGGSAAVLFLDLHGLKEANDRYGHPVGNVLLRQVAGELSGRIRAGDVFARIGGDEFLVLMPDAGRDPAQALAERLRKTIEDYRAQLGAKGPVEFLSVSIGAAVYPANGGTLSAVITAADRAMYRAKQRGGSAVEVSDEVVIQEPDSPGGEPRAQTPAREE